MRIGDYYNVFGASYQNACRGFTEFSVPKKIAIGILTGLFGICTLGIAALPVFRLLTENWKPKSTPKVDQVAQNTLSQKNVVTIRAGGKLVCDVPPETVVEINIENCKFKKVPSWVFECTNAKKLILYDCGLTELSVDIKKLKNLTYLDLGKNNLTKIPDLSPLSSLETLCLQENSLKTVLDFSKLPQLRHLELHQNPELEEITGLKLCSKLQNLLLGPKLKDQINNLGNLSDKIWVEIRDDSGNYIEGDFYEVEVISLPE
jgi:Leucine-rich repeat (LRR) protein